MYDANGDGVVSVLEMIRVMDSHEFSLTQALEDEVLVLANIMENKRYVTQYGGGFIDRAAYQNLIQVPAFPIYLKDRLIYIAKNGNALYQKRYEQIMADV